MNELEPLCNVEQSKMLKELGFGEETSKAYTNLNLTEEWRPEIQFGTRNHNMHDRYISRPTISLAKNWLYDKYGIWIETSVFRSGFWCKGWDKKLDSCLGDSNNINPHQAESDCLTEVLKRLTNEQIHNPK